MIKDNLFNFCLQANKVEKNALELAKKDPDKGSGAYTFLQVNATEKVKQDFINRYVLGEAEKLQALQDYKLELLKLFKDASSTYGVKNAFYSNAIKLLVLVDALKNEIREARKG